MGFYRKRSSRTLRGGKHRSPIAWFTREGYPRIIELLAYPEELSRDFDRWHELAQDRERHLKRRGFLVVRVEVRADELLDWCAAEKPSIGALNGFVAVRGGIEQASRVR